LVPKTVARSERSEIRDSSIERGRFLGFAVLNAGYDPSAPSRMLTQFAVSHFAVYRRRRTCTRTFP